MVTRSGKVLGTFAERADLPLAIVGAAVALNIHSRDHIADGTRPAVQQVLDEADRLLTPTFAPELAFLLEQLPAERQTLLFTATLTDPSSPSSTRRPPPASPPPSPTSQGM